MPSVKKRSNMSHGIKMFHRVSERYPYFIWKQMVYGLSYNEKKRDIMS
jgi:hypothetical protein